MRSKRPPRIIVFSEISWNFLYQRHHIFTEKFLEMYSEVIFVERVISRIPSLKEVLELFFSSRVKKNFATKKIKKIKYQMSLFLPNTNKFFILWNKLYWHIAWKKLQKNSDIYSFTSNPYVIGNKENTNKDCKVILDIIHNWWNFPFNKKQHQHNINRFLTLADTVISDSQATLDIANHPHSFLVSPGVHDYWFRYSSAKAPRNGKYKIIFFGNLRHNNDIRLLKELAMCKKVKIDFFGLIDRSIKEEVFFQNYISRAANSELPRIISNYHFIVLPYQESNFSNTISPAKFYESMATGKALISNSKLTHIKNWEFFTSCIDFNKPIEQQLDTIISNDDSKSEIRIKEAKMNNWTEKLNKLENIIG